MIYSGYYPARMQRLTRWFIVSRRYHSSLCSTTGSPKPMPFWRTTIRRENVCHVYPLIIISSYTSFFLPSPAIPFTLCFVYSFILWYNSARTRVHRDLSILAFVYSKSLDITSMVGSTHRPCSHHAMSLSLSND